MFIIVLLCSLFIQLHASEVVVSAEELLGSFVRRFRGETFEYRQSSSPAPTDNLITIHIRSFTRSRYDLPTLVRLITSGSAELVSTVKVHDPHHALMHNGTFSPELYAPGQVVRSGDIEIRRARGSTRTVGLYNCKGNRVCIKQWPEAAWNEIAVYQVYQALFQTDPDDSPIPVSEVLLINGQIFLASKFMEGDSFNDILAETLTSGSTREYAFNLARFQRTAILVLITLPEDGGARNLLVRDRGGGGEKEFILIDNDRNFGIAASREIIHPTKGPLTAKAHSTVLCLYELLAQPILPEVFGAIMQPKSGIVSSIVVRLLEENGYQLGLQAFVDRRALAAARSRGRETILGVPLNGDSIKNVSSRLDQFVREVLSDQSQGATSSLASIFTRVCEPLAKIYRLDKLPLAVPAPRITVNLRTILERIADVEPRSYPGAVPPVSAYAFPAYCGATEINTEMLLNVLTWINSNCDTLDAGEKEYIASIIATIDSARVSQSAVAITGTRPVSGARGRGISALSVVSSGRGFAAAQVFTSARGGCGAAVASAGGGKAIAVVSGGRGACARSGGRIVRRGR